LQNMIFILLCNGPIEIIYRYRRKEKIARYFGQLADG